jgi:hypothetical protein
MADRKPPGWFDADKDPKHEAEFKKRKRRLEKELPGLLKGRQERGRANSFLPYLLVRSVIGDRGDRPINVPFWESPDIWTAPGDPSSSPAVPPDHGGTLVAGEANTVYAHVWNLGFAPLAGIVVEFYWFNPSLAIDGTHANLIGTARCELAGRGMPGSHALVKCPQAWVPVMENGGHECLVVRVYGIGDPLGANEWQPWLNRHVGQRNVSVVTSAKSWNQLLTTFTDLAEEAHRIQLIQLAPQQGKFAARIVAPQDHVARRTQTHLLAELDLMSRVGLERPKQVPAGMLAPVHPLNAGGAPPLPVLRPPGRVAVIEPSRLAGRVLSRTKQGSAGAKVATLLRAVGKLQEGAPVLGPPDAGETYALRIASSDSKGQLIGGYTVVVPGK